MDIADEVGKVQLNYIIPAEGSNIWFDGWCMPKGANVTILGEVNSGWSQVKYGSITGYASRQYLSYDQGGIASGIGYMPKATLEPERVLSPRQTKAFEKLVNNITTNPVLNALSRVPSVNSKLGNLAGETNKHYFFYLRK